MLTELKALVARSSETLLEDALGVAALAVMLFGALHLPGLL
ncbi:hypothetical protein [Frigidibacter sp. ROC022]|nr:hypothetical protein [Frigidibacter sp. ROC022]MCR8725703.1 hypothetical protein [Frigidibacter sp. ROC022]